MGATIDPPEDGTPPAKSGRTRGKLLAVIGLAGVALVGGLSLAGVDDVIDLPAWASIPGVDIPILGDIDQLCLLYTSPSPRDRQKSRMPSSA